jgi:hypothetical protein
MPHDDLSKQVFSQKHDFLPEIASVKLFVGLVKDFCGFVGVFWGFFYSWRRAGFEDGRFGSKIEFYKILKNYL